MIASFKLLRLCLAALLAASMLVSVAYAQKWSNAAPFPDPSEEVYGIAVGGKLYVLVDSDPSGRPRAWSTNTIRRPMRGRRRRTCRCSPIMWRLRN